MKKPTHITCKRWFQKTYGNTYFSAYVSFDDGSTEQVIKFEYGYGSHCLDETLKYLEENGFVRASEKYENGMRKDNTTIKLREECKISYEILDVNRKKDM